MTAVPARPVARPEGLAGGTARVALAEALLLPTGLIVAVFLARRLGNAGYGHFALAVAVVGWVEWSVSAAFGRATVQFVGEARDWRPVGTTVLRLHLAAGGAAGLAVAALAGPLAALLGEPALAGPLRLLALDIPLFCLAQAHRNILIGLGAFAARATVTAARWILRAILIVALVGAGLGVAGAALGAVGASLGELLLCRRYARPGLRAAGTGAFPARRFWASVAPLFLGALALRLYDKLDLLALTGLRGVAEAGAYAAAQNLAVAPGLFALAFSPALLATLARTLREGEAGRARQIARDALRAPFLLLPFAGLAAGAAPGIIALLYGPAFGAAAAPLAILIFGALALTLISIASAILIAAGRPGWTLALSAPLVPLALAGHLLLIPPLGGAGAALAATLVATGGAAAALAAVRHAWGVAPPPRSVARGVVLCAVAGALARLWPAGGAILLVQLAALGGGAALALLAAGELPARFPRPGWLLSGHRPREA